VADIGVGSGPRLRCVADEALRYEAAWFDHRRNAWPDLRAAKPDLSERAAEGPLGGVYPTLWCHGAAGIGMTRLRIHQLTGSLNAASEAAAALQATCSGTVASLKAGAAGHGLTVCHGHGGAAELFLMAHETLGEPEHLATARWVVHHTIAQSGDDVERWPIGVDGGGSSYGLMTGLAGALAVCLRAAHPLRFPPVGLPGVGIEAGS